MKKKSEQIIGAEIWNTTFHPRGFGALKFLLEKEFKQIWRNKFLIRVIFLLPLLSLALLPMVANFEIKNNNLAVVDHDHSPLSELLIKKITSSGHFRLVTVTSDYKKALKDVEQDRADVIIEIPAFFEKNLMTNYSAELLVSANAVNAVKGALGSSYLAQIINNFSTELRNKYLTANSRLQAPSFEIVPRYDFNPHLEYKYSMIL